MPVIARFFGIQIRMYYREHGAPHFHAEYRGQMATFTFEGAVIGGRIDSGRAIRLIARWASQRRPELSANWERMKAGQPLEQIDPLT